MKKMRLSEFQKRILKLLDREGAVSTGGIAEKLNASPLTASRNLKKLLDSGLLTRKGRGRSTYYVPVIATQLRELQDLKEKLDAFRPFPEPIVEKIDAILNTRFIYSTRTIEGAKLPLRETALVLSGISIKGNRFEIEDVLHQKKTLDLVDQFVKGKRELSETYIKSLQREVTSNTIDILLNGVYRDHEAGISGTNLWFPAPSELNRLMSAYIASVLRMERNGQHPAVIAAYAHYKLLDIHPFADGNGRTARLVMNSILLKHHFPVAVIESEKRDEYYRVLQKADQGAYEIFEAFIFSAIKESLEFYLKMIRP